MPDRSILQSLNIVGIRSGCCLPECTPRLPTSLFLVVPNFRASIHIGLVLDVKVEGLLFPNVRQFPMGPAKEASKKHKLILCMTLPKAPFVSLLTSEQLGASCNNYSSYHGFLVSEKQAIVSRIFRNSCFNDAKEILRDSNFQHVSPPSQSKPQRLKLADDRHFRQSARFRVNNRRTSLFKLVS